MPGVAVRTRLLPSALRPADGRRPLAAPAAAWTDTDYACLRPWESVAGLLPRGHAVFGLALSPDMQQAKASSAAHQVLPRPSPVALALSASSCASRHRSPPPPPRHPPFSSPPALAAKTAGTQVGRRAAPRAAQPALGQRVEPPRVGSTWGHPFVGYLLSQLASSAQHANVRG